MKTLTNKAQLDHRLLEIDTARFHPRKAFLFHHKLTDHPLLQLSSLLDLAKRLQPPGDVRHFCNKTTVSTDFRKLIETHGNGASLEETLEHIETPGSWVGFHYIESDPLYKK